MFHRIALLTIMAGQLSAATLYTDRNAFLAAANISQVIAFEGIAPSGGFQLYPSAVTIDGATFTGSGSSSAIFVFNNSFTPNVDGTDYLRGAEVCSFPWCGSGGDSSTLTLTLPAGITAFGLDFNIHAEPGSGFLAYDTQLSTGDTTSGGDGLGYFLGYISSTPLSSFSIHLTVTTNGNEIDGQVRMDNVRLGTAAAASAPEPGTVGFSAGVLLALLVGVYRRSSSGSAIFNR